MGVSSCNEGKLHTLSDSFVAESNVFQVSTEKMDFKSSRDRENSSTGNDIVSSPMAHGSYKGPDGFL